MILIGPARGGTAMLIPFLFIHPTTRPLGLTIRNLHGPEDRHAQEADGDDGEAHSARA